MNTTTATTHSIVLSPAHQPDLGVLVALRVAAMRASLERIGRFDPVRARERSVAGFAPEETRHIELDGERVGFVVVKTCDHGLLLDHLYVHPDFQGRGIGSAVLQQVFVQADQAALPVRVGALRGSDSNRFYQRHGFRLVDEAEWDVYYMRDAGPC